MVKPKNVITPWYREPGFSLSISNSCTGQARASEQSFSFCSFEAKELKLQLVGLKGEYSEQPE